MLKRWLLLHAGHQLLPQLQDSAGVDLDPVVVHQVPEAVTLGVHGQVQAKLQLKVKVQVMIQVQVQVQVMVMVNPTCDLTLPNLTSPSPALEMCCRRLSSVKEVDTSSAS